MVEVAVDASQTGESLCWLEAWVGRCGGVLDDGIGDKKEDVLEEFGDAEDSSGGALGVFLVVSRWSCARDSGWYRIPVSILGRSPEIFCASVTCIATGQ